MLTNPVVISVIVMTALCLFRLNVILSLLVAGIIGGLAAGISLADTMAILIGGMGGNAETALSYVLLGALGDAGSPASDTTLGPTAGLNADGQHDHIWDTCVPTFLCYNIPLMIFGVIGAMFF